MTRGRVWRFERSLQIVEFPLVRPWYEDRESRKFTITAVSDDNDQNRLMFCLFWYKTKLEVLILGKLSKYFSSFVFMTQLWPKTCHVFHEHYMKNRSCKLYGNQLSLSSTKFRVAGSKPMLFIVEFHWTFVLEQKLNEIAPFVQWKIC